jgi:hypothetical protein
MTLAEQQSEIREILMDMKGDLGAVLARVDNIDKRGEDQEKRLRDLEHGSAKSIGKQSVFSTFAGLIAGVIGTLVQQKFG